MMKYIAATILSLSLAGQAFGAALCSSMGYTKIGTDKSETIYGTAGNDKIHGKKGNDTIHGKEGSDCILGARGSDKLYGDLGAKTGSGNDEIWGSDGADTIVGGFGNDYLRGGEGDDSIWGGEGDDDIYGGDGSDYIHGGCGNDRLRGGDGTDAIIDDCGNNTYRMLRTSRTTITSGNGDDNYIIKGAFAPNGKLTITDSGGRNSITFEGLSSDDFNRLYTRSHSAKGKVWASTTTGLTVLEIKEPESPLEPLGNSAQHIRPTFNFYFKDGPGKE